LRVFEGESAEDLRARVDLAIDLDIGIDEVIQRRPCLFGNQVDVAAHREADAVWSQVAEIVILQLRVLIGLGDIDGNPALAVNQELGPAVVAPDLALATLHRKREAYLELGRYLVGPG